MAGESAPWGALTGIGLMGLRARVGGWLFQSVNVTRHRLRNYLWRQPLLQHARRVIRPARFGTLRRTTPLSPFWGFDRGAPVDRYYIERFLERHQADIRGRALEVQDSRYTRRYGVGVTQADVLDIKPTNPCATVIADLAAADTIPDNTFDCFILTQTLQMIYDTPAAIRHAWRILRPGGVLLVTLPACSRIIHGPGLETDYWRFTEASCRRLFGDIFGPDRVTVRSCGNVLTNIAFLSGLAYQELSRREMEAHDPYHPLIITVRAVKEAV